ncbi:hypothetical protein A8C56_07025 [Niabella ginsenosidivorans]|uniref:Protochlamydia outer membrane protein domain-containing protein n=1 Tax=Niabella ginsenosidivorans TaxID=1176587 RepID=A0A1A9I097_9BACT|nr:hypothetical protein [Niabella ginsenosidivorans]ANH80765.1 hypothetical protein A8C56_07025 [Niabella ginsenosidivorans]
MGFKKAILILLIFCHHLIITAQIKKNTFQINIGPVLIHENFKWSIAGNENGTDPNILSELKFKNIRKTGGQLGVLWQFSPHLSINAQVSQLHTFDGNATDIDYAGDDRTNPIVQLNFVSKKGKENDFKTSLHYLFMRHEKLRLAAGAGYYFSKSGYFLHGVEKSDNKGNYVVRWRGPVVAFDGGIFLYKKGGLQMALDYRYLFYHADADWALRNDFAHPVSFTHNANGVGINVYTGLYYSFSSFFQLQLGGFLGYWHTGHGIDVLYMANGDLQKTKMNESLKNQWGIRMQGVFNF